MIGAYGLIIGIAQLGAITGSTIATNADRYGISQLFLIGSMTAFSVSLLMKIYMIIFKKVPKVQAISVLPVTLVNPSDSESKSFLSNLFHFFRGFYDGFLLILKYNYTLKIFAISCLYEIVVTVLDYQFKILGASKSTSTEDIVDESRFANLLGHFGQFTNIISFVVSIFGFSLLVHRFGVKYSLLLFPSVLFLGVILINLVPTLPVLFISVSILKALIFSFHDPVKELLYNPTSDAIKFKAKAWIDVFGKYQCFFTEFLYFMN